MVLRWSTEIDWFTVLKNVWIFHGKLLVIIRWYIEIMASILVGVTIWVTISISPQYSRHVQLGEFFCQICRWLPGLFLLLCGGGGSSAVSAGGDGARAIHIPKWGTKELLRVPNHMIVNELGVFFLFIHPFLIMEYLGGLGKKFLRHIEILPTPTCFLGFQKEWRGVLRMPQFSREIFLERVNPLHVWNISVFTPLTHPLPP